MTDGIEEIKRLTPEDLEFVRLLRNELREWFFDEREVSSEQQKEWFVRTDEAWPKLRFWVVWYNGLRAGCFSLRDQYDLLGSVYDYEVGNIMLASEFRHKGCMRKALTIALPPFLSYVAYVKPHNASSIKLFESLGFQEKSRDDTRITFVR